MSLAPLRPLGRVAELPARVSAVGARVHLLGADAFVAALERLVTSSRSGNAADADALLACALWLIGVDTDALRDAAARAELPLVSAMLADDAPHKALARHGRLADVSLPETARVQRHLRVYDRDLPWPRVAVQEAHEAHGDYPWDDAAFLFDWEEYLAAPIVAKLMIFDPDHTFVRRQVDRLVVHPSATVIARLLRDRATKPRDVLRIATRRPTTAAIVRELTAHYPSMNQLAVRSALASNPFTPTRVALLLVPTCRPRLRSIARANVHARVRALAELLA